MPQLVDANEDTVQPDPPEDKQSDYDFEEARNGGAVEEFYNFNAIEHGLSDPKFISNNDLRVAWEMYRAKGY
jgi:hypothetical protein